MPVLPCSIACANSLDRAGTDLKGCKKIKALASRTVSPILDLTTCSAEDADNLDVASLLRHHAIPAGSPGSYAYASILDPLPTGFIVMMTFSYRPDSMQALLP